MEEGTDGKAPPGTIVSQHHTIQGAHTGERGRGTTTAAAVGYHSQWLYIQATAEYHRQTDNRGERQEKREEKERREREYGKKYNI
jgi:hypothetical protein